MSKNILARYKHKPYPLPKPNYEIVDEDPTSAFEYLRSCRVCALDIETSGLDPYTSKILLIQLGTDQKQFLFDMSVFSDIKQLIEVISTRPIIVGHNLKFDLKFLYHNFGFFDLKLWDTYTYEKLITAGCQASDQFDFRLKGGMAKKYLNKRYSEEARKSFIEYEGSLRKKALEYAATDIILTYTIYKCQIHGMKVMYPGLPDLVTPSFKQFDAIVARLMDKPSSEHPFKEIVMLEMDFVKEIALVELNGFKLDPKIWVQEVHKVSVELDERLEKFKKNLLDLKILHRGAKVKEENVLFDTARVMEKATIPIRRRGKLYHEEFKITSNEHVLEVIRKLGYEVPNTRQEVLSEIDDPLVKEIVGIRELNKIVTSYGEKYVHKLSPVTRRIHADFDPYLSSGRITPREPNVAQIPRPNERVDLRRAFVGEKGYKIITADISGCELRIIAELCQDPGFIKIFNEGGDLHRYVASLVFNKPQDEVTSEERTITKTFVFGYAYGAGPGTLARNAGIAYSQALDVMKRLEKQFPKFVEYFKVAREKVTKLGAAFTIGGRPRFFHLPEFQLYYGWDILSYYDYYKTRGSIERAGGNHPVQGTNADVIKTAVILFNRGIRRRGWNEHVKIVNLVHDEMVVEAKEDMAEKVAALVRKALETALSLYVKSVPPVAEVKIDDHWVK